jgi:surface antigen
MSISFDVYGTPANSPPYNLSPNGVHEVSWWCNATCAWPGTGQYGPSNGSYYAEKYFGYPDPYMTTTTLCHSDGSGCIEDKWRFFWGQCTSWVAWRLNELNGVSFNNSYRLPSGKTWGNADNWWTAAKEAGINYGGTHALGSVAWWPDSQQHDGGHVAYVEKVISSTSIIISEMNYDNLQGFRLVTITKSGGDWPYEFLYIGNR